MINLTHVYNHYTIVNIVKIHWLIVFSNNTKLIYQKKKKKTIIPIFTVTLQMCHINLNRKNFFLSQFM
jgi:hypothetical protein